MPTTPISQVTAAAADGRVANVFFRQEQLQSLHDALVRQADAIQQAISKDSGNSTTHATIEYCLALGLLKKRYYELDAARELEAEYRVANGKNAADRREGVGIAYIVPSSHTLFYSVVVSIAGAIAAGNCIILELPKTLRELPSLLHTILRESLDHDIFAVSDSIPKDEQFFQSCVLILQSGERVDQHYPHILFSPSKSRVVAVVDRTADLQQAAKALVAARMSFGGRSPYAPDLVVVNEFVKKAFLNAVVQESIQYMTESSGHVGNGTAILPVKSGEKAPVSVLDEVKSDRSARIVTSGSNGAIVDVESRTSPILRKKINERCLVVHATTSIDDSIDFISSSSESTLPAAYLFATPAAAKYLGQFIKSDVSFINHIPTELLVGPVSPSGYPIDPSDRYPTQLFSVPRAQYINSSTKDSLLSSVVLGGNTATLQAIKKAATADLNVKKRAETYGIGFFEQGILLGLGMVGVPILALLGTGVVYGVRFGWRTWQARR